MTAQSGRRGWPGVVHSAFARKGATWIAFMSWQIFLNVTGHGGCDCNRRRFARENSNSPASHLEGAVSAGR
jgi:hypothetical protein